MALFLCSAYTAGQTSSPTLTTLYNFTNGNDGANPSSAVVLDRAGIALYGVTGSGGASSVGTVYLLAPPRVPGGSWSETTLYSFAPPNTSVNPCPGVVVGNFGVLYGTSFDGGTGGAGAVFSLTKPSPPAGAWTEAVLHSFTPTSQGINPLSGVEVGSDGVLYGTTAGGSGKAAVGTVFALKPPPPPGGTSIYKVLHYFNGTDGAHPYAAVAIGPGGVLYGTTVHGGTGFCGIGFDHCGTVFSMTPPSTPGGAWTEAVLHNFTRGSDGINPEAPVAIGSGGVLYGTTPGGGTYGFGTVFSLTPPVTPGGTWTETVLYNFPSPNPQLSVPERLVVAPHSGVLYGTTVYGGPSSLGTLYSLTPPATPGGSWTYTLLHAFTGGSDGSEPLPLVMGGDKMLYGSTHGGGSYGFGTVFSFKP